MSNPAITLRSKSVSQRKFKSDDDMKEYAETAMNELLGWYGYDKLNKVDSQALNLCLFSSGSTASTNPPTKKICRDEITIHLPPKTSPSLFSSSSSVSSDEGTMYTCNSKNDSNSFEKSNSTEFVHLQDTRNGAFSLFEEQSQCACCLKEGLEKNFIFQSPTGDQNLCSEQCLNQYRRAESKRNKTCDWCRHVRHTVTYVDLQDGDSQYQFCSDKCLNQFKLDIFCQETKEHLEMHPCHQKQLSVGGDKKDVSTSSSSLITPDLWLRNCVSPSNSDKSRPSTPNPVYMLSTNAEITLTKTNPPEKKAVLNDNSCATIEPKKMKMQENSNFNECNLSDELERCKTISSYGISRGESVVEYPAISISLQPARSPVSATVGQSDEQRRFRQRFRQRQRQQPSPHDQVDLSASNAKIPFFNCDTEIHRAPKLRSATNIESPTRNPSILQIPPLLPISRPIHSTVDSHNCSNASSDEPNKSATPLEITSSLAKSLLPPATILVPYPIVLPIPIPLPIPLPFPVPISLLDSATPPNLDIRIPANDEKSTVAPVQSDTNDSKSTRVNEECLRRCRVTNNFHSSTKTLMEDNAVTVTSDSRKLLIARKKEKSKK